MRLLMCFRFATIVKVMITNNDHDIGMDLKKIRAEFNMGR